MSLTPIPGDYRPPGLVREPVYYAEIEKRLISKVIEAVRQVAPPQGPEMQHIKRVLPASDPGRLTVLLCPKYRIDEAGLRAVLPDQVVVQHAEASRYPARSKEEAEEWSREVWPLMWRGNVTAQPPSLSAEKTSEVIAHARPLVLGRNKSACCDICKIVDPNTGRLLGISEHGDEDQHPLKHSVMLAISAVTHNLSEDAYLCKDVDVYCSQEPCVMCCMALVHSRIGRIVYTHESSSARGPIRELCLHGRSQLNHTFEAWHFTV